MAQSTDTVAPSQRTRRAAPCTPPPQAFRPKLFTCATYLPRHAFKLRILINNPAKSSILAASALLCGVGDVHLQTGGRPRAHVAYSWGILNAHADIAALAACLIVTAQELLHGVVPARGTGAGGAAHNIEPILPKRVGPGCFRADPACFQAQPTLTMCHHSHGGPHHVVSKVALLVLQHVLQRAGLFQDGACGTGQGGWEGEGSWGRQAGRWGAHADALACNACRSGGAHPRWQSRQTRGRRQ